MERVPQYKIKQDSIITTKEVTTMIKHIFLDMDGTLLNSQGTVSTKNITVIQKSGLPTTLVSARAPIEMEPAIKQLSLTAPQIAFNGGMIFQPQSNGSIRALETHALDSQVSFQLISWLSEHYPDVCLSYYTKDSWLTTKIDTGIKIEMKLTGLKPSLTSKSALQHHAQAGIFKVMLIVLDKNILLKIQAELTNLHLTGIVVQQSGSMYLEITSQEATKSRGLSYIVNSENLLREETAAFGDGHNDLPMLTSVGTPIVMGNALDVIKTAGKFVTKTNDEDGVAYGIETYIKQTPVKLDNIEEQADSLQ